MRPADAPTARPLGRCSATSRPVAPDAMIYVNCDASYRGGWAGIAYQSDQLESQSRLVECKNNGEAELRALLLAMTAAEKAHLPHVIFRTDCESAARPHRGESEHCAHCARRRAAIWPGTSRGGRSPESPAPKTCWPMRSRGRHAGPTTTYR